MTNAQLVSEINRLIRGIGLNYPDGLDAIQAQLDQLRPKATVTYTIEPVPDDQMRQAFPGAVIPITQAITPESEVTPIRRGPGRPKGSKSQHNRPAAPSESA